MPLQYTEHVVQALAQRLAVPPRAIRRADDLYRDWGLTPLSLVLVLLDLERLAALELPAQELRSVHTVADLVLKFRAWVHLSDAEGGEHPRIAARRSRTARNQRRTRRVLHHLRWLEQQTQQQRPPPAAPSSNAGAHLRRRLALSR